VGAAFELETKLGEVGAREKLSVTREDAAPTSVVDVDSDAMTEALLNVLQNAVRYTGDDKRIGVRSSVNEGEALITITDNGPGIPKHEQGRIFEKFYSVVDPADPNVVGSGLGLPIVHQLVRAHLGKVTVDSDVGRGASFTIALPLAEPTSSVALAKEP
jgi:two-component system phosphate regulon sensor histidine kinase PhoR